MKRNLVLTLTSLLTVTTFVGIAPTVASGPISSVCVSYSNYVADKFSLLSNGHCPHGYKLTSIGFPANSVVVKLLNDVSSAEWQSGFNNGAGMMRARCIASWFPPAPGQQAFPPNC